MRKADIAIFLFSGIIGSVGATDVRACPPCPSTAKYCISPNTPNSHCEANLPELRTLETAITVSTEGKTFIMGPTSKVTITSPN